MDIVTDTHPLVWALFAQKRLSTKARQIFEGAAAGSHHIFVPTMVMAEAIMVVERGRVTATLPQLLQAFDLLASTASFSFLELRPATVIASHALAAIPDIFDRLVVAEAQRLGLPLLSRDRTITEAGVVDTVWE